MYYKKGKYSSILDKRDKSWMKLLFKYIFLKFFSFIPHKNFKLVILFELKSSFSKKSNWILFNIEGYLILQLVILIF